MSMDLPRAISLTLDASAAPSMVPPRAILLWLDAPAAPSMDQPKAILLTCVRAISHTCVRSLLLRNVGKKPETAVDFLETLVVRPGGGSRSHPALRTLSFGLHDVGKRGIAYSVVIGWRI